MKHSFFSLTRGAFVAAAALMAAGCSNEEISSDFVTEGTPIRVSTITNELTTKAGYGPNDAPADFYLQITNESNSKYSYYAQMKDDNGTWKSFNPTDGTKSLPMYWAGDGNDVKVTAATFDFRDPTTLEPATSAEVTIASDQSDDAKLKTCDHLMQLATATKPSLSGITVNLTHIMAKLRIVVDLGTDNTDTANPLSYAQLGGTNLTRTYTFTDPKNPAWTDPDVLNVTGITPCPGTFTPANATASTPTSATMEYEAIVVPQTVAKGTLSFCFEKGYKTYTWKSTSDLTFDSNTQYTLNLKLHGDALTVVFVNTADWGAEAEINGGAMDEEDTKGILVLEGTTGGELSEEKIAAAINNGRLKIIGVLGSGDFYTLAKNTTIEELDLSEATGDYSKYLFRSLDPNASTQTYIGNNTLKKVVLPQKMTEVPYGCFLNSTSLTSVTLPSNATTIGSQAFYGCTSLGSVELPEGVTTVNSEAFYGSGIESITLPNSLTTLGEGAFQDCKSLKEITIPASVTSSSYYMFDGCKKLEKATYLSSSPILSACDFQNTALKELYLPNCESLPSATDRTFEGDTGTTPTPFNVHVSYELYKAIYVDKTVTLTEPWSKSYINIVQITSGD